MKKALFTLFAALLLLAVACEKEGGKRLFPDPATKNEAVSIKFDRGEVLKMNLPDRAKASYPSSAIPDTSIPVEIAAIDLTESSRYVLYITKKANQAAPGKFVAVWTGKYTFSGDTYKLDGFGNISIKNNSRCLVDPLTTKAGGGTAIEIDATIVSFEASGVEAENLARCWKVNSTYIKLAGGSDNVSISKEFNGCDLHEIGSYLKSKGFTLSDSDIADLTGYNLDEIFIIGNGTMIMNFDGPDPYYGTWSVKGERFSWGLSDGNKFISATVTGSVSFPDNRQAVLLVDANVSTSNEKYTGSIGLTMSPVN